LGEVHPASAPTVARLLAGLDFSLKVNRKDWGLNWNVALEAGGLLVGDQIKLEVEVALTQAAASIAA